jgi:toxin ParE1/3/4
MANMTRKPLYKITSDAQTDLKEIRKYTIQQWGTTQSKKYLSELRNKLIFLSQNPMIGKQHQDLGNDTYSFPYVSHTIYYTLNNKQLVVFGVLHQSMVPAKHLEQREGY